ncbi:hypothetical protein V8G54_005201, partial [Vigna mungo]
MSNMIVMRDAVKDMVHNSMNISNFGLCLLSPKAKTEVPARHVLPGSQPCSSCEVDCQTPPGGFIAIWKLIVARTVATIIRDPLLSSIQLCLPFRVTMLVGSDIPSILQIFYLKIF